LQGNLDTIRSDSRNPLARFDLRSSPHAACRRRAESALHAIEPALHRRSAHLANPGGGAASCSDQIRLKCLPADPGTAKHPADLV